MNGTHYLATAWIDEHLLRFTALPFQARLRITFGGIGSQPEALGSVIGLDTDEPGLRVSAPLHVEWAALHSESIITEASRIWAVTKTLDHIREHGVAPDDHGLPKWQGKQRPYKNKSEPFLPSEDGDGDPITYSESDGRAWYTDDHYGSFIPVIAAQIVAAVVKWAGIIMGYGMALVQSLHIA